MLFSLDLFSGPNLVANHDSKPAKHTKMQSISVYFSAHLICVYIYIYMMYIDVWYIRCICVCYMKYMIHIIFSTISFRNVTGGCGLHVDMTGRQV